MSERRKAGRDSIFDQPMTPAELQRRHREKLRKAGQKQLLCKINSAENVKALQRFRDEKGLKSDTAAAIALLNNALDDYRRTQLGENCE